MKTVAVIGCFLALILSLSHSKGAAQSVAAYYPFAGNANDVSGNGRHGTVSGAALTTDREGKTNSAYTFSGSSWITLPNTFQTASFTFSAWYYPTAETVDRDIFTMYADQNNFFKIFKNYADGSSQAWLKVNSTAVVWQVSSGDGATPLNQWSHICVVVDAQANMVYLYINGWLKNAVSSGGLSLPNLGTVTATTIGKTYEGTGGNFMGKIDEVSIYNRALTAKEVREVMNLSQGLLAWYPYAGDASDVSGNGRHGTVYGAALSTDREGKTNSAYTFSGSSWITLPNTFQTASFTFSAWYYPTAETVDRDIFTMYRDQTNLFKIFKNYADGSSQAWLKVNSTAVVWKVSSRVGVTPLNQWSHICVVVDAQANNVHLYINGDLESSASTGGLSLPNLGTVTATTIGKTYEGTGGNFVGIIDEVRIYGRAVSASEVRRIMFTQPSGARLPGRFSLEQNYPNPFNPSTTIRFSVPERSFTTLRVFNSLGQQVAQLLNGEMEAGMHEITFDATSLPSGAYFYRLLAGGHAVTRKLLIVR